MPLTSHKEAILLAAVHGTLIVICWHLPFEWYWRLGRFGGR
jgi:hypothetical protein